MTEITNTFVSEIVATRLSHDLIGNIGSVANAAELLEEGDIDAIEDIRPILNYSSKVLSRRLKFFRLCFGLSNSSLKEVSDLEEIVSGYLATLGNPNNQIRLALEITTPKIYKIVMPAVMMMADTLVKGGEISVIQNEDALTIEAKSGVALNGAKLLNIKKAISGEEVEENPSTYAPLYYLLSYLESSGINLKLEGARLIIGE